MIDIRWLSPRHYPSPFEILAREDRTRVLNAALATLTDEELDIVELRCCQELTFPEIAIALERPLGAVKMMHFRAMPKLRCAMETMRPQPIRYLREVL